MEKNGKNIRFKTKTIRILYENTLNDLINANYIGTFLETLGVFLWKYDIEENAKVKNYLFDFTIIFGKKRGFNFNNEIYFADFLKEEENMCSLEQEKQKEILQRMMVEVFQIRELGGLNDYIDYYIYKNVFQQLILIKYNMHITLQESEKNAVLLDACNLLFNLSQKNEIEEIQFYIDYAKFKYIYFVDKQCILCDKIRYFHISGISSLENPMNPETSIDKEYKLFIKKYEKEPSICFLIDSVYSLRSNTQNERLTVFDRHREIWKNPIFGYKFYSSIGKIYEPYPDRKKAVMENYKYSYLINADISVLMNILSYIRRISKSAKEYKDFFSFFIEEANNTYIAIRKKRDILDFSFWLNVFNFLYLFIGCLTKEDLKDNFEDITDQYLLDLFLLIEKIYNENLKENSYIKQVFGNDSEKIFHYYQNRYRMYMIDIYKIWARVYGERMQEAKEKEYMKIVRRLEEQEGIRKKFVWE